LLLVLGLLLWCGGAAARPFLGLILGPQYADIGPIFLILVAARVGVLPVIPLNVLFFAQDRTRAVAAVAVIQLVALIVGGYSLIPWHGAVGAAWTQLLVTGAAIIGTLALAWSSLADGPPEVESDQKSVATVGS
jgi:O-antigen/teichoic acid export membrane protein